MGNKLEQSRTMIAAADSGAQGRQRASEELQGEYARGAQEGAQLGQSVMGAVENVQAQGERKFQHEAETGRQALEQQKIDVSAAEQGYQRTGSSPTSPLLEERQKKLDAEMNRGAQQPQGPTPSGKPLASEDQQRLKDQASKPVEFGGGGSSAPFAPTQEGITKLGLHQGEVAAKLKNADANMMNAQANYKRAQAKGDAEGMAKNEEQQAKSMATTQQTITDVITGKASPDQVAKAISEDPQMQGLMDEKTGRVNPARVVEMLRTKLGQQQLSYMATHGGTPPDYDPDNPVMKRFNSRFGEVASAFRGLNSIQGLQTSSPAFAQAAASESPDVLNRAWQGITSYEERNRFLRQTTAQIMMEASQFEARQGAVAQATGQADKMMQLMQDNARKDEELAQMKAQMGYGASDATGTVKPGSPDEPTRNITAARRAGATPQQALQRGAVTRGAEPAAPEPRSYGDFGGGVRPHQQ